jgi:hypothetical protein
VELKDREKERQIKIKRKKWSHRTFSVFFGNFSTPGDKETGLRRFVEVRNAERQNVETIIEKIKFI